MSIRSVLGMGRLVPRNAPWDPVPSFPHAAHCSLKFSISIPGGGWRMRVNINGRVQEHHAPHAEQQISWTESLMPDPCPAAACELQDNVDFGRSEKRRVGKECVRTWRSRWSPDP